MLDFTKLKLNTDKPVYLQIVYFIKLQIYLGVAKSGDELPSRRELASILSINPNTSQKAFKAMEESGLVATPKNSVSTLEFTEQTRACINNEMENIMIGEFVKKAKENKLTLDRTIELILEEWKRDEN